MAGSSIAVGQVLGDARRIIGWSQRELARRSSVSQSAVSRLERGRPCGLELEALDRIASALGGTLRVGFDAPFLADRARQLDSVHARCIAHVATRLRRLGWELATEVEIDGRYGPGWIDVLAFHELSGVMLVVEIKTEIRDIGRIQRTLGWYEHRAWLAARQRGWRVRRSHAALLLLATDVVDARLRENRAIVDVAFPGRAADLVAIANDPGPAAVGPPSIAMIDPLSRRDDWLRPTRLDGRRVRAPYEDYAGAARRMMSRARPPRR